MSPKRHRALSCLFVWLLVLSVPLGLLAGIGLPWWQRMQALEEQIDSRKDRIQRYQNLIASLPQLRAILKQERSNQQFKTFYYRAQTAALAGAQLQRTLQKMVSDTGARLINTQFLPAQKEEQPPRVHIRTQIQGDTQALRNLLLAIENAKPFLFIDQMSVRSSARRVAQRRTARNRRTAKKPKLQWQLTIRLDLFGYALENTR